MSPASLKIEKAFPELRDRAKLLDNEGEKGADGGGVEGVGGLLEVDNEVVASAKFAGLPNQDIGEIGPDAPVPMFVGVGQSVSRDRRTHAHVPEFVLMGAQTAFDVVGSWGEIFKQALAAVGGADKLLGIVKSGGKLMRHFFASGEMGANEIRMCFVSRMKAGPRFISSVDFG